MLGQAGRRSSGWRTQPFFLNDGLQPGARYAYQLKVRDIYGNVSSSAPVEAAPGQFTSVSDSFGAAHDYLAQGVAGTVWEDLIGKENGGLMESVAAKDGVLRLQSHGTVWDGGRPRGPFLYQTVQGDFVVQVKVADYAGLAGRQAVGATDGGLMVRLPQAAGPENLVQLTFFPPWNQGNMTTTMVKGGRQQKGNMLGFDADRYLQIIRTGAQFHFRTSPDGKEWKEMPGSPIARPDMAGKPVQVGLMHATYGDQSSFISLTRSSAL